MGISVRTTLHHIDELCIQANLETDPAKIADTLKEIIRELDQLLDAVDQSLGSAPRARLSHDGTSRLAN